MMTPLLRHAASPPLHAMPRYAIAAMLLLYYAAAGFR